MARSIGTPTVLAAFMVSIGFWQGVWAQEAELSSEAALAAIGPQVLGDRDFVRVHMASTSQGYMIESGNLTNRASALVDGSLVMVTQPDGAITAILDRPGQRGLLSIDKEGKRTFVAEPAYDYLKPDSVPGEAQASEPVREGADTVAAPVDALVLFSTAALGKLSGDPTAFALAQLETANLGLRNSQVGQVQLRLAGIRVIEDDHPVSGDGLEFAQPLMTALRPDYRHDINVAYFEETPYGGMAYMPGWSSVNSIHYPLAFRHEVGHNAGGDHCNDTGKDNYRFGYQAANGAHTFLCGNNVPYYSTPQVSYGGQPLGNARTADMARVWREQAQRMSGYSPEFEGERLIYTSYQTEVRLLLPMGEGSRPRVGVVALSPEVGPTALSSEGAGVTTLTIRLAGRDGRQHPVNFRAHRQIGGCTGTTVMNSHMICHPENHGRMALTLAYHTQDNPELASGWYNGTVQLKALDLNNDGWSVPILLSLAVQK